MARTTAHDTPRTGDVLARRYQLGPRIASGGMGTVYRGWDQRLNRVVALKLLHPHLAESAGTRDRFAAEARHAARVRHRNVVTVLDSDLHDGLPFIVLELVDGPSLRDVLDRHRRLTPQRLLHILEEATAGLGAIHDAGLVHRDVKPANLLYRNDGILRVADFGISKADDTTWLTPMGTLMGSVQYVAPEVVLGSPATWASDQYSLGVVAFEILTGTTPLPADVPIAAALRHARERVPLPSSTWPQIDGAMDRAVTTATARDPHRRYPSLQAMLEGFGAAVTAGASVPRSAPTTSRTLPTRGGVSTAAPTSVTRSAGARPARVANPGSANPPRVADGGRARPARVANPSSAHPSQAPQRRATRAKTSALALLALCSTLLQIGAFVAPVLGVLALRRIGRSGGRLRGDVLAMLAVVIGLLRLLARVLTAL